MSRNLPAPRQPTRAERRADALVHLSGITAALIAAPALVIAAITLGAGAGAVAAAAVYGLTLVAMVVASALYHMIPRAEWKRLLLRLDHAAIHFKIAGTYTPLSVLSGGHGGGLVAALWGAALAGSGLRFLVPRLPRWFGLAIYLGMGWAGVLAGSALLAELEPAVAGLVLAGGILYTVGVVFFMAERLPYHTAIWHGCVLVASALFFTAIALQLGDAQTMMPASATVPPTKA